MSAEQWTQLFWTVLQAVLVIALPTLVVYGIRWLEVKIAILKTAAVTDKNAQVLYNLEQLSEMAVHAAEQQFSGQSGYEKKAAAITFVQAWLTSQHIQLDIKAVEAAIEAAVFVEFNSPAAVHRIEPPATTYSGLAQVNTGAVTPVSVTTTS